MATKEFKKIDSKGHEEVWTWEETPELIAALKQLEKSTNEVNSQSQTGHNVVRHHELLPCSDDLLCCYESG